MSNGKDRGSTVDKIGKIENVLSKQKNIVKMGKIAMARLCMTVTLNINEQNLELIKKLHKNHHIESHVHLKVYDCDDEVSLDVESVDYEEKGIYDEILSGGTTRLKNDKIHFTVEICEMSTWNLCYREHAVFGEEVPDADEIIEKIQKSKQIFLDLGVPNELIKTGYTMYEM